MDRVREQRDGPRDGHDRQLEQRRDAEHDERDLHRADPAAIPRQRVVDRVAGVVAVPDDRREHPGDPPRRVRVPVPGLARAMPAFDVVVVGGVDVVRVRAVVVRMIRPVRRAGLVLVGARAIGHRRRVTV